MAPNLDHVKSAFNVLMTTGHPRVHPHVYFGLPIKFIAIIATFIDLIFNIFPAIFSPPKYRIIFLVVFCTRITALYTIFQPKLKYLQIYRGILVATILCSFTINVSNVISTLLTNECHKLVIKHTFTIAGILTPIELLVFIAISSYTAFIIEEENNGTPPSENKPETKEEADETKTQQKKENTVRSLNELKTPLMGNDINDLD